MRTIKYILINDKTNHKTSGVNSSDISIDNLGHHFVINSAGAVLNPIDVCQPGNFMPKPTCGQEDFNKCSIGIKYNGSLEPGTLNFELRVKLIHLLVKLRSRFPDAKILALNEIRPNTHGCIHVRDDMNKLRKELSNYP